MSQRVFCKFCEQEFFSSSVEECALCRQAGGLILVEGAGPAEPAAAVPPENEPPPVLASLAPSVADQSAFQFVPWSWAQLLVAMLPVVVLQAIFWFGLGNFLLGTPGVYVAVAVLVCTWCLLFPLRLTFRANPPKESLFRSPRRLLLEAAWAIPITVGLYVLVAVVAALLYLVAGDAGLPHDIAQGARRATSVSVALLAFVVLGSTIAPLAEEVLFRGMIYNLLRQKWHFLPAIVLQALVFAAFHIQPLMNLLYIFIMGLLLALVYEWRRTLWAPAFAHIAFNSIAFAWVLVAVIGNANAPLLGVSCEDRKGDTGCIVKTVLPGTAAEQAGLQVGDVIVGFNGAGIWNFGHLMHLIRSREVGENVTIQFYRGQELLETTAQLQRRPSKE